MAVSSAYIESVKEGIDGDIDLLGIQISRLQRFRGRENGRNAMIGACDRLIGNIGLHLDELYTLTRNQTQEQRNEYRRVFSRFFEQQQAYLQLAPAAIPAPVVPIVLIVPISPPAAQLPAPPIVQLPTPPTAQENDVVLNIRRPSEDQNAPWWKKWHKQIILAVAIVVFLACSVYFAYKSDPDKTMKIFEALMFGLPICSGIILTIYALGSMGDPEQKRKKAELLDAFRILKFAHNNPSSYERQMIWEEFRHRIRQLRDNNSR